MMNLGKKGIFNEELLGEKMIGNQIEVTTGQSFHIEMRNPAAGGYLFQEPEFDKNILEMKDQISLLPPANNKRGGDFGSFLYIFKAISPGRTEIIFRIYRPWETEIPPKEYQRVKVVVSPKL